MHAYTFDAENKILKVDTLSAYIYDGEGQRVRKLVGENLRFIYGIGGQEIAEFSGASGALQKEYIYGASGLLATIEPTAVNSNGTRYTTSDNLGTPRVVTNSSAGIVSRHDYKPFGEEIGAGIGSRTTGMGYSVADGVRQRFTQYERDNETGLDYAHARYYSSIGGRFTSTDPLMASGQTTAPQTWNRYSYALNNPLKYMDPSGLNSDDTADQRRKQEERRPRQAVTGMPPPPGGPVTPSPIKIDVGPAPLLAGEVAWPTTLEVVPGENKNYNGDPIISPSGEVIDEEPNYGVGRTVDYIIRDQAGNPMSNGVLLRESVAPSNPQAEAMMRSGSVDVNNALQRPDNRGIVPDTLGLITRDQRILSFLKQNQIDAKFVQTITVFGVVGGEYRTALILKNEYQTTNSGVKITTGPLEKRARPK